MTLKINSFEVLKNKLRTRKVNVVFLTLTVVLLVHLSVIIGQDAYFNKVHFEDEKPEGYLLPVRSGTLHKNLYREDVATNLSGTWTHKMAASRRRVFKKRAQRIQNRCQQVHEIPRYFAPKMMQVMNNLRWVRSHNMVWCPIFKSASTTWVKNLLVVAGERFLNTSLHKRVKQLYPKPHDPAERKQVLESSMKVIIVRHPLDRLLSAYRDKMLRVQKACDPYVKLQKNIAETYNDPNGDSFPTSTVLVAPTVNATICMNEMMDKNQTWPLNATSPPNPEIPINTTFVHPTFSQFLLKVGDDLKLFWKKQGHSQVNLHWRPYWITCGPCKLNYDVIAHVETLGPDQEYIIRELGLQDILYNTHTHASKFDSYNGTSEAAKHYFSRVSRTLLKRIIRYYQPDFEIFGYSPEPYISLTKKST